MQFVFKDFINYKTCAVMLIQMGWQAILEKHFKKSPHTLTMKGNHQLQDKNHCFNEKVSSFSHMSPFSMPS